MANTKPIVWIQNISEIQEVLDKGDDILGQIEYAVHRGQVITEPKAVQRLCVLIASRYAQAASMLYTLIRHQEEQENLKQALEK